MPLFRALAIAYRGSDRRRTETVTYGWGGVRKIPGQRMMRLFQCKIYALRHRAMRQLLATHTALDPDVHLPD